MKTQAPTEQLTGLQLTTLNDIECGSVSQCKFGYGAWRIQGGNASVVGKLISRGLAKWGALEGDRRDCALTDAGKAALAKARQS